jgi:8-oxo-dGTP diphosphatase
MQRSPDSRPPIAAAVVVNDGQVLLIRRRVAEGSLSWQFPAGEVEAGESAEDAAVREALEEADVKVKATSVLGERIHPATKRLMVYVACDYIDGLARAADADEVAEVAWCEHAQLAKYVPNGFFEPVQRHIDELEP